MSELYSGKIQEVAVRVVRDRARKFPYPDGAAELIAEKVISMGVLTDEQAMDAFETIVNDYERGLQPLAA